MRYSLGDGIVIKTENAAKPDLQEFKALSDYISRLEPVGSSFDYGCGKLRYAEPILRSTGTLTVVELRNSNCPDANNTREPDEHSKCREAVELHSGGQR